MPIESLNFTADKNKEMLEVINELTELEKAANPQFAEKITAHFIAEQLSIESGKKRIKELRGGK